MSESQAAGDFHRLKEICEFSIWCKGRRANGTTDESEKETPVPADIPPIFRAAASFNSTQSFNVKYSHFSCIGAHILNDKVGGKHPGSLLSFRKWLFFHHWYDQGTRYLLLLIFYSWLIPIMIIREPPTDINNNTTTFSRFPWSPFLLVEHNVNKK